MLAGKKETANCAIIYPARISALYYNPYYDPGRPGDNSWTTEEITRSRLIVSHIPEPVPTAGSVPGLLIQVVVGTTIVGVDTVRIAARSSRLADEAADNGFPTAPAGIIVTAPVPHPAITAASVDIQNVATSADGGR